MHVVPLARARVQALHLCETQPALARELMAAAQDPMGRDWPFMCTGLGFTKQALVALRRGDVYAQCNGRGEVLETLHELYVDVAAPLLSGTTLRPAALSCSRRSTRRRTRWAAGASWR